MCRISGQGQGHGSDKAYLFAGGLPSIERQCCIACIALTKLTKFLFGES